MNSFNIDTDAGIGNILSNFSTEYIMHVIDDSLQNKFRPFDGPMPNMVDILERNFKNVLLNAPDYVEKTNIVRKETYLEIISKITNSYQLAVTQDLSELSIDELYGISRMLYDVLVSRFTDNMIDFFANYIIKNSDAIYSYLKTLDNINRPKSSAFDDVKDNKFLLIHANANMIIYNISAYDISLAELFNYCFTEAIASRLLQLFVDTGDIYKNYYANYIKNPNTSPEVITRIKLQLQTMTFNTNINNGGNQ